MLALTFVINCHNILARSINLKIKSMKRVLVALLSLFLVVLLSCEKNAIDLGDQAKSNLVLTDAENGTIIPGEYIVLFKEAPEKMKSASNLPYFEKAEQMKAYANAYLQEAKITNGKVQQTYTKIFSGFSVKLEDADYAKLTSEKGNINVYPNRMVMLRPPWEDPDDGDGDAQQVPYGTTRVGYADGTGKTAWIIDSGIDLDHPDLLVDAARGYDFSNNDALADDDNGHGSHCAGTVAALDNEIGVIGVAYGATVVPVKVLNRRGSGAYDVIIAGIDFVATNASPGDAANMSLGGGVYEPIDQAVVNASNLGIYFALAAGNESEHADTHSPARANGPYIWTISAMDDNDNWASFSNYGNPPVDFCMPGVNTYSTYKNGGYATMSGTSMASPHMCGILLLTNGNPKTDGYVNGDPDGNPDPIGHK